MTKPKFEGKSGDVVLPTRQEMIDTMLVGTTMWWELVGEDWVCYFSDCKDTYDHLFLNFDVKEALQKLYNRILSYGEKSAIFRHEAPFFAPKENGKIVELKEWKG